MSESRFLAGGGDSEDVGPHYEMLDSLNVMLTGMHLWLSEHHAPNRVTLFATCDENGPKVWMIDHPAPSVPRPRPRAARRPRPRIRRPARASRPHSAPAHYVLTVGGLEVTPPDGPDSAEKIEAFIQSRSDSKEPYIKRCRQVLGIFRDAFPALPVAQPNGDAGQDLTLVITGPHEAADFVRRLYGWLKSEQGIEPPVIVYKRT